MNERMQDRVVITGMGLVSPLGRDLSSFWSRLAAGDSGVSRWNGWWGGAWKGLPAALCGEYEDDPCRGVHFGVEASLAALEDAGLPDSAQRRIDPGRFGIAIGNSKGGIGVLEQGLRALWKDAATPDTGGVRPQMWEDYFHHSINTQVMRQTGICGPCASMVSACSTGAHNIALGALWIKDDAADWVLAGAAESSLTPLIVAGFDRMGVLAKAGPEENPRTACRPYDHKRRGFVMGEGAGVVVLERLSTALSRGAKIYAELSGWGFCADAYKLVSFNPEARSIRRAMGVCARRAGVAVNEFDYVNTHGTGTVENDRMEAAALKGFFAKDPQRTALSSTKAATGHLLGAAGSVELIGTALALAHDFVPPTLNLVEPDPECDLDFTACRGRPKELKNALSLSYGFGGHVAALAVQKPDPAW